MTTATEAIHDYLVWLVPLCVRSCVCERERCQPRQIITASVAVIAAEDIRAKGADEFWGIHQHSTFIYTLYNMCIQYSAYSA